MFLVKQKIFLENEFVLVDFKARGGLFFVMFGLLCVISKQ